MRQKATLRLVWTAVLVSTLAFLGVAVALRPRLQQGEGLGVLTWMAIAWCVLATVTAVLLRSMSGEAAGERRRGLLIASYGLLDSGAVLAAVSHLVSPLDYGIYAAFVPLAALLAFFPRLD